MRLYASSGRGDSPQDFRSIGPKRGCHTQSYQIEFDYVMHAMWQQQRGEIVPNIQSTGPKGQANTQICQALSGRQDRRGRPAPIYARQYPVDMTEKEANTHICQAVSSRQDRRGRPAPRYARQYPVEMTEGVGQHPDMLGSIRSTGPKGQVGHPYMPDSMCLLCDCMVCSTMGELTKLHAYNLQFWFQVPLQRRGRRQRGSNTSYTHIDFLHLRYSGIVL